MVTQNHVELAKMYCRHYHKGQFRKGNNLTYSVHPHTVAGILKKYGYDDPVTQCIAYLHDTMEDSPLRTNEIQEIFGYEVSNAIFILSRNKGKMNDDSKIPPEDYLRRLSWARNKIKRVKIADMIDNTRDLENLSEAKGEIKIQECESYYIPWGKEMAPMMIKELVNNIQNFRDKKLSN